MSSLAHKLKSERLERELAHLTEEHVAVSNQYEAELNEKNRLRLKRDVENLEKQIAGTEQALNALESSSGDANRQHLDLDEKLPRLDYQEIKTAFREIFGEEGECGCAALFLLQNSNEMGGKWGVRRMQDLLKEGDRHFTPYSVAFTPIDRADERSILDRLAGYVEIEDQPQDLKLYAQNIIGAIRESLQGASVVFIEIKGWDAIKPPERALRWFLEVFWIPLAHEMATISKKYSQVKIVSVLITDGELVADGLEPYFGVTKPFDSKKIIKLKLRKWTQKEIANWLPSRYPQLETEQINELAERIFKSSGQGNPVLVYNKLLEYAAP